ncbi:MAG: GldM family protein [Flavobacterium sp.]
MKNHFYSLFFLFFSLSFYGQNDSIVKPKPQLSVVAADKMNVVYRGVPNPISIAVNKAKSYTVSGDGVSFVNGKYILKAGSGTETKVIVEIKKFDGSKVVEEHVFRIKGLPSGFTTINGHGCASKCIVELTYQDLQNARIDYEIPEFLFDFKTNIIGFQISFIDSSFNKVGKTIDIKGNKINKETLLEIKKVKAASQMIISNIRLNMDNLDMYICKISPLKILILK